MSTYRELVVSLSTPKCPPVRHIARQPPDLPWQGVPRRPRLVAPIYGMALAWYQSPLAPCPSSTPMHPARSAFWIQIWFQLE